MLHKKCMSLMVAFQTLGVAARPGQASDFVLPCDDSARQAHKAVKEPDERVEELAALLR
jgi:hypothetical protein